MTIHIITMTVLTLSPLGDNIDAAKKDTRISTVWRCEDTRHTPLKNQHNAGKSLLVLKNGSRLRQAKKKRKTDAFRDAYAKVKAKEANAKDLRQDFCSEPHIFDR